MYLDPPVVFAHSYSLYSLALDSLLAHLRRSINASKNDSEVKEGRYSGEGARRIRGLECLSRPHSLVNCTSSFSLSLPFLRTCTHNTRPPRNLAAVDAGNVQNVGDDDRRGRESAPGQTPGTSVRYLRGGN
ncbi:hypothetical protein B0H16DRAFT_1477801 [Mycena metata]|uniref:Uncharacterized protein n=1 Tax=Mycena metata TaxID=1033252 RepID=A0AAD7H892_9AGAR|nr:hypothetical protein B0H16DRAFT_1477801 [Mycena metata]